MQRRAMLKIVATGGLLGTPVLSHARTATPPAAFQPLDPARWSAANRNALDQLILRLGSTSRHYDPKRKPYAVFDWDNTCIMNDCEEALMMVQIDRLAFDLSPEEFATVVRQDVPDGPFKAEYKNNAGSPVNAQDIAADIEADYRWLHANFKAWPERKRWSKFSKANSSRTSAPRCVSCTTPSATVSRSKSVTSGSSTWSRTRRPPISRPWPRRPTT